MPQDSHLAGFATIGVWKWGQRFMATKNGMGCVLGISWSTPEIWPTGQPTIARQTENFNYSRGPGISAS